MSSKKHRKKLKRQHLINQRKQEESNHWATTHEGIFEESRDIYSRARLAGDYISVITSEHDEKACKAMIAYEKNARLYDVPGISTHIPLGSRMSDFAAKAGTTTKEMKQHWRCVDSVLGPDPEEQAIMKRWKS